MGASGGSYVYWVMITCQATHCFTYIISLNVRKNPMSSGCGVSHSVHERPKFWGVKYLAQSHTASKCDINTGVQVLRQSVSCSLRGQWCWKWQDCRSYIIAEQLGLFKDQKKLLTILIGCGSSHYRQKDCKQALTGKRTRAPMASDMEVVNSFTRAASP